MSITMNSDLGKLNPRKIAPSPNSNANPKPNPDPDRGDHFPRGQFFGHQENTYNLRQVC